MTSSRNFTRKKADFGFADPKPEVLVVPARDLIVQIDVKELARFPGLRDRVHEIEPGHLFVRDLRIHAHHVGILQRRNEPEIVAGRGHVDVAARLVGLGLEREPEAVLPIDGILAQIVHRVAQALDRLVCPARGVGFGAFAAAPQDENLRAELRAEIHRAQRFLHRVRPHRGSFAVNAPSRNTGS